MQLGTLHSNALQNNFKLVDRQANRCQSCMLTPLSFWLYWTKQNVLQLATVHARQT